MVLKMSTFTPVFNAAIPRKFTRQAFVSQKHCPPSSVRQYAAVKNSSPSSSSLLQQLPPTSAYIHLPFCRKRCHYCDFPIIALGGKTTTADDDPRISNYVDTICREIKATPTPLIGAPLETVFFGGGTPSLVPPRLVSSLVDALSSKFGVRPEAEISMEMDPGTFDAAAMHELMGLGVNRVSLGVQAFQDELLKACGRAHGVAQVYEAFQILKSCGVHNWSLDLISSLPHQTPAMWEQSLQLAVDAQPTHVSVYDLQVEQGTKFGVLYSPGEYPLPCEDQSAEFYRMASTFLRGAGYEHYEISSYSKSGYRCKHNSTYWNNKSFYAFGLGSASYVSGVRFSRPKRLKEYTEYVQNLEEDEGVVVTCPPTDDGIKIIDAKDLAMDVVMLSLRTADGLDLKRFAQSFGDSLTRSICEVYRPHVESGLVIFSDDQGRNVGFISDDDDDDKLTFLRLSDPDGFLLSNELLSLAFRVIAP